MNFSEVLNDPGNGGKISGGLKRFKGEKHTEFQGKIQ